LLRFGGVVPCYADIVVDQRNALEELRIADREAVGLEGELEANWQSMDRFMADFGWRKPNRGRIRRSDLRQTVEDLEMICARAEGAAGEERRLPPFRPSEGTEFQGRGWTVPSRHARKLDAALLQVHARRRWLREAFEQWRGTNSAIQPLSTIAAFQRNHRKRIAQHQSRLPSYVGRAVIMAAVFLGVAGFALKSAFG